MIIYPLVAESVMVLMLLKTKSMKRAMKEKKKPIKKVLKKKV